MSGGVCYLVGLGWRPAGWDEAKEHSVSHVLGCMLLVVARMYGAPTIIIVIIVIIITGLGLGPDASCTPILETIGPQ